MAVVQTVTRLFLSHSRASCTSRLLPVISMKHASTASTYQFILTEKCGEKKNVGLITLNRPKQFNVVSAGLLAEMANAVQEFDKDESVAAIVVTGSEKAFAAGDDKIII
ncbi:hypothetical protein C0J52_21087 [Blattella germanica]|nr:hypothetical protein C0J52_21087 [Blattella germanica]